MSTLDEACFGNKPESFEDVLRARAADTYRGRYGEPSGSLIHVPGYAEYRAGDRVKVNNRHAVVLRADHELGIIEVAYGNAD